MNFICCTKSSRKYFDCYDGNGYAEYPGGVSTIDSTLAAVLLLHEYDTRDWSIGTTQQLQEIKRHYISMQSDYRGGFVLEGADEPDMHTTALVLETLEKMDSLSAVDIGMVTRYLWSSFRGSLSIDTWLNEGGLYDKYWGLRAANAIDNIEVLGIRQVDLDHIVSPTMNMTDFPQLSQYIRFDSEFLSGDEMYGGGFEDLSYIEKVMTIESIDVFIENELFNLTLMPTFVDVDAFVEESLMP